MVHFVQRGVSHVHAVVHSLRPHYGQSRQFAVQVVEQQFEQFPRNTDVFFCLSVFVFHAREVVLHSVNPASQYNWEAVVHSQQLTDPVVSFVSI